MKKKAEKLSKTKLWAIISAGIVIVVVIAIIITNVFVPIKYLASYCVSRKRENIGSMRVTFVDVGFGDCIIVELPDGKNMLIDAGDGKYSNNSKVIKALNKRNIDTVDYLVCSSVNSEHCGGLTEVLKYKEVKTVYMPYCTNKYITDAFKNFVNQTEKSGAEIIYIEYKTNVKENDYFFTFLSPSVISRDDGEYAKLNKNPSKTTRNNSSSVIWLEYGDTALLFTSDVETSILNSIVFSYGISEEDYPVNLKKCKVVQLANHGNAISACAEFYDLISPEAAVISVGENGSGSPSVQAMSDVINSVGKNLFRTDERGSVTIKVTAAGYTIK
ncbi:MAG: MBL fold metallo-hydrolase [Clostridia bacterium]|nr:MBL fold metallo-hydrolase [Clostridia bacterium]